MDKLKECVISLKSFLESELRKEGSTSQNSNSPLEDLNYTDFLNTMLSQFTERYLKKKINSIFSNINLNLDQIENELIFASGEKVKILNQNRVAIKNDYHNKEPSRLTHLNTNKQSPEHSALFEKIEKNFPTMRNDSFDYDERLGQFKLE